MKFLYTAWVWFVGFSLLGVIALLSVLVLCFIPAKRFSPVFKGMFRFLVKILFIKVEVSGFDYFQKKKSCIIMPNHGSYLDVMFLTAFTPYHIIGIEEKSHFSWPLIGWVLRLHGNLPINRGSITDSKKTYAKAEQKLYEGAHLVIFPEGGRTTDGKLRPFKKVPFLLAKNAKSQIIPLGIKGVFEMNNKNSVWVKPMKISMCYGSPISVTIVESLSVQDLLDLTRTHIEVLRS